MEGSARERTAIGLGSSEFMYLWIGLMSFTVSCYNHD
jgi:hypothetical protein